MIAAYDIARSANAVLTKQVQVLAINYDQSTPDTERGFLIDLTEVLRCPLQSVS